jgi:putative membrane-bound dehydrogenase-like protein
MRTRPYRILPLLLSAALLRGLVAEELKTGNNAAAQAKSPAEEQASFRLPPGFSIELVASEETGLPKPVTVAFDDSGRLWSVTATEYPRDQDPGVWTRPGADRVVVVDHPERPGPQVARTFADGMVLPLGVLPYGRGAVVAQGPEMLLLEDTDGDGRADSRKVLLKGFGIQDTHTLPHQLEHLPGGWIVFSQGVLNTGNAVTTTGKSVNFDRTVVARFRPDGSDLEILGAGLNNIWSWVQDRTGRVFFHEANDFGYSLVPFEQDTTYPSFIRRLVHPASPYHPPTAPNLNLGGTGFSGLALSDDRSGSFPDPWHGVFFVANPITRRINTVSATLGADGVHRFEQKPDLVSTDDDFFRPVALRFGPDGCLYIVDWYNRIISHNEIDRNHPARDKTRGRVWRVRHQGQVRRGIPDVAAAPTSRLLRHLRAPSTWEMRAAWHQIVQRRALELAPGLVDLARSRKTPTDLRIHALWCLEGLGRFDAALWQTLLADPSEEIRFEAVRSLTTLRPPLGTAFPLLRGLSGEPTHRVRAEVLRFFRQHPETPSSAHLDWLRQWKAAPDLTRTVKGWDRDYLEPGAVYQGAFRNLLLRMVEEKVLGTVPTPQSARFTGAIRTAPPRPEAERREIAERIRTLTATVDATQDTDIERGRKRFENLCAGCHSIRNDGAGFGPSLSGSRNRTTEAILTALLDPSQAVEGVFRPFQIETADGGTVQGFFGEETPDSLTLRFPGGRKEVVPLQSVKQAGYVDGRSVMPEGLLDGLDARAVADLVRYLRSIP